jgi:hypothetical protein
MVASEWVVQPVHSILISTWGKVPIDVNSDADTVVSELIPNIRQRFPRLNQQARIGVPDVMHPNFSEFCLFNGFVKDPPSPVINIQRISSTCSQNPLWELFPILY